MLVLPVLLCSATAFGQSPGEVDGSSGDDTITIDSTDISSNNTLQYNDGSGIASGTSTSPFSTFVGNGVGTLSLDGVSGNNSIRVTDTPSDNVTINITGGTGNNTITVESGATLTGDIDGGTGGTNTVELFGVVSGNVSNANVTMDADADGATVAVGGALVDVGDVILVSGNTGTLSILNTNGETHAISATGPINITDATSINGSVSNRDSTTQAGITVEFAGDGSFLSLGEISVTGGGAGALINTQLELNPPADSPGITITFGGAGDATSDGTVTITDGGVGTVQGSNLILGDSGQAASYIARNLTSLNNVNELSLGDQARIENSADLGQGDDLLSFSRLERSRVGGAIDGGADSDTMNASGFLVTGLEILFETANDVEFVFEHRPFDTINILKFETFNMNNESMGTIESAVYGHELERMFYNPSQGDPLDNLVVQINGSTVTQGELALYRVAEGSSDTIAVTGDHPLSGESLTYNFTPVNDGTTVVEFEGDLDLNGLDATLIRLSGLDFGEFDRNEVADLLSLAGDLTVELRDGHSLGFNETYEIFTADTLSGTFDNLGDGELVATFDGVDLYIDYDFDTGTVTLFTVPEPTTFLLLSLGGLALWRLRR